MASTIILKNGTGSAIPSALAHGEPAINVDTGLFYYGSGSVGAVKTFSNFTDITASLSASLGGNISASGYVLGKYIIATGNISASGNISATGHITSSGRIQTLSHITASGNISSSGKIYGNEYRIGLINFASVDGNNLFVGNSGVNPITLGRANTTPIYLSGNVTSSSHISSSGTITGRTLVATGNISASGNISATGYITSSGRIQTLSHITASGNISASGTIITEDLQVDTITNHTAGGGIILDADGFIGIDSAGGDIRFRDAGANQLHFDMDGTDGAQVISPSVAGDDIIFKNQGGDSVLTLKSEGQTEIHGHITASGNISSSGNIYSNNHEILTAQTFKIVDLDNGYYGMPGNSGYSSTTWGFQKTDGADGLGNGNQHIGVVMPYKAILVGVIGQFRASATGNYQFALWTEKVEDGDAATATDWTETIITSAVNNNNATRTFNFEKLDGTTAFVKGTSVIPSFYNDSGTDNSDIFGNYTIVIQRVI